MTQLKLTLSAVLLGVMVLVAPSLFAQTSAPPASQSASRPAPRPASQPTTTPSYPAEWIGSFKTADTDKAHRLASLTTQMKEAGAALQRIRADRNATPGYRQNAEKKLSDLRMEYNTLWNAKVPPIPKLQTRLEIGDVGPIIQGWFKVVQVLGKSEAIGEICMGEAWSLADDTGVHRGRASWQRVLLVGMDTSAMADGQTVVLGPKGKPGEAKARIQTALKSQRRPENQSYTFIVTGTRRLKTVGGGSTTDFIIEQLDENAWKAAYMVWKKTLAVTTPPAEKAAKQP